MTQDAESSTSFTLEGIEDRLLEDDMQFAPGLRTASEAIRSAIHLYESFDKRVGWQLEAERQGDTVYAKFINGEKYYGTTTELPMDVDSLFREVWTGVPMLSTWNTNIAFSKIIKTLTPNADILHYGTADVWVVKGRDFVVGRIFRKIQSSYVMAARSFQLGSIPELREKVRGHLILAAARYSPHPTKSNVTMVDYLMCTDFKGAVPAFVINQLLARLILKDAELNKNYVQKLARERQKKATTMDNSST